MRAHYLIFILLICFACGQPTATDNSETTQDAEDKTSAQEEVADDEMESSTIDEQVASDVPMVYVTHDGDKYHTADCRYSKTAHEVKLSQAKADGKTACGICKPSSTTGEKQVRCSGKTAEGNQCSRMTTDASGTCFQHRNG